MKNTTFSSATEKTRTGFMLVLLFIQVGTGCVSSVGDRKPAVETRTLDGFTITESVRPRIGLRSDFASAYDELQNGVETRGIEELTAIVDSNPSFAAPHINLGIALREAGEFEKAEDALVRALEANPRHPVAHNELGIVYRRLGKFQEARASYESALEYQPSFHYARKNLAIICDLFLGDLDCALENYEIYHAADPADENVSIWIADLRQRAGR